nr:hypothetical protein [Tanacetum cinerariifolium]
MRRVGKGFSGVDTPLFDGMLVRQQVQDNVADAAEDEDAANEISAEPTPPLPTPATPPPPQQELIPLPSQTYEELTEKELKQVEANDQAIQTILLCIPEEIYAAIDSCKTAQEIWLRVQQMMKGKIASNLKFLNNLQPEWSRHVTIVHQTKDLHTADYTQLYDFVKYNQKEVDDLRAERLAKTHDPLALMANSNNLFNYPVFHPDQPSSSTYMQQPQPNNNYNLQPSFNQNYMQQLMLNSEDIINPTTTINMALVLMAKAFKLNYSTLIGMNMGQDRQMLMVGETYKDQRTFNVSPSLT